MRHETRRDPKRESSNEHEAGRDSGSRHEGEPGPGGGMRSPRRADESESGSPRGTRKKK